MTIRSSGWPRGEPAATRRSGVVWRRSGEQLQQRRGGGGVREEEVEELAGVGGGEVRREGRKEEIFMCR